MDEHDETEFDDEGLADNVDIDDIDLAEINKLEGAGDIDSAGEDVVAQENLEIAPGLPLYQLLLPYSHELFFATYKGEILPPGMMVLIPTRPGKDLARITCVVPECRARRISRLTWIIRPALPNDLEKAAKNAALEEDAFKLCRERIAMHGLDMKLVTAHYMLDEPKIIFFFTSENRVDFRDLVKDLTNIFHARIELRQVGIRDETRILGGLGACGRDYCCHAVSDRLKPVSIKMAKEQGLSLNSMKISGPCGRLLCCIAFENQFYSEQWKSLPHQGCKLSYDGEVWKVTDSNVVIGMVTLAAEDGRQLKLNKTNFTKVDGRWTVTLPPDAQSARE